MAKAYGGPGDEQEYPVAPRDKANGFTEPPEENGLAAKKGQYQERSHLEGASAV